jgi:acetoin utilization protein AcuB
MKKLTVRKFMTPSPFTIGARQKLSVAHQMMRQHRIRHLPVLEGGKLVGMLTDRDMRLVETLRDVDPAEVDVDDAMTPEPYAIGPDTSLEWVAVEMAAKKYGSVVVVENGKVVGVFTTVDALHALTDLLAQSRRRRRARATAEGGADRECCAQTLRGFPRATNRS